MNIDRDRASAAITEFLRAIGHDPDREPALKGTGRRVTDAFVDELCKGEREDAATPLRANRIDASGKEELVLVKELPVATVCPHHLMPATGFATVAFRPKANIVGIGAVGDLVEILSRRLSLQETMGEEIVRVVFETLEPVWAGCRISLTHTCMVVRDEKRRGTVIDTVALRGEVDRALAYRVLGATP